MLNFPFFKEIDSQIIVNAHKIEVFIPSHYFDSGDENKELAYMYGTKAETLGIFYFKVYNTKDSKGELYLLNIPMTINIDIYEYEEDIELNLEGNVTEKYFIFKYEKDDIFINQLEIIVDSGAIEKFLRLLTQAKLPKTIQYDEILETFINAMETSGITLNLQGTIFEIVIAELCRDIKNPNMPFRFIAGKKNYKETDYQMFSITDIPKYSSAFTGIIFERIKDSLVTGINNTRLKRDEKESPLEKTIKY